MSLYDSHCHLHDARVGDDAADLIARATEAGVGEMLLAGVDPPGWRDELALMTRFPQLRVSYGVHPQIVAERGSHAVAMVDELEIALAGGLPRPVAVGEIGLDALEERAASLPLQEELFRRQLDLAKAKDLPVILHVLRAHPRALEILAAREGSRGVLHSCSASADLVKKYLALGWSISFAGAVCDPGARRIRAAAQEVPLDRLLVETDAPDQTPKARRPARNEPAFLVEIVAALAQIRGESADTIGRATAENARRLFDSREKDEA